MKRCVLVATLFFTAAVFAQERSNGSAAVEAETLSSLKRAMVCNCGCSSMTIQACIAGMQCGTSPKLGQEIEQYIKSGMNRQQVLDAMVAKYGQTILAAPPKEGFNLTAWILPFVALIAGGWAAAYVVRRWKRQSPAGAKVEPHGLPAQANNEYEDRFEKEFRQFNS